MRFLTPAMIKLLKVFSRRNRYVPSYAFCGAHGQTKRALIRRGLLLHVGVYYKPYAPAGARILQGGYWLTDAGLGVLESLP